jgi:DNA-directed RNA polymerase specialized sigma24 family protein
VPEEPPDRLIRRTADGRLRGLSWHDRQDAYQEGWLAFLRTRAKYDPDRGTLKQFINVVVRTHLWAWDRRRRRHGLVGGSGPNPPPRPTRIPLAACRVRGLPLVNPGE